MKKNGPPGMRAVLFGGGCQQKKGRYSEYCNGHANLKKHGIFYNLLKNYGIIFSVAQRRVKKIKHSPAGGGISLPRA
ncbi:hypothetical protein [uncultured Desulfovibrio sp.]|uniref:hypothetical protein n=1 Tax=uncultured Desulfovibrio sp. TaxID=167968 RepID=UPI00280520D7|nr:hypothetical protein [uncultured Desulfovibrio sp.]